MRIVILLFIIAMLNGISCASDSIKLCQEKENNNNYGDAVGCYERILNKNKSNVNLALKLATIYEDKINNIDKAKEIILDALKYNPENFQMNFFLMDIYFDKNNEKKGMEYYQNAARIRTENEHFTIPPLSLYIFKKDKSKKTIHEFLIKLVKINPSDVVARSELARMYISEKNYSEAQKELETVLKYDTSDGEVYFNLGVTYFSQLRYKEALINFSKAKELGFNLSDEYIEATKKMIQ
jgi:tetratricopeptide (TPR) repeat protein